MDLKLKTIFKFSLLLMLAGCSALELLNGDSQQIQALPKESPRQLYCQNPHPKSQLLSEDADTLDFYKTLDKSILHNSKYSFIDKSIMITLIELIRRPDQIGPHSRFQFYLKLENTDYYYDFTSKELNSLSAQPLIVALDFLAKKFKKNNALSKLVQDLEKIIPNDIPVSEKLGEFLRSNTKELQKNDIFYDHFYKGDEVVTKYETFKRQSFKKTMSIFPKSKNIENYNYKNTDLFGINALYQCNFKINNEVTYLKNDSNHALKKSHSIGFIEGNNIFLATASFELDPSLSNQFANSYFLKAHELKNPLPFCFINKSSGKYGLFSSKDRNPEQFMQHLLTYEIENSTDHEEVNQILNFSRHLVLSSPDRILYESKKGRKNQLNFFLTMNFPVYHIESLGNIFGFATIPKVSSTPILHIDARNGAKLWCSP